MGGPDASPWFMKSDTASCLLNSEYCRWRSTSSSICETSPPERLTRGAGPDGVLCPPVPTRRSGYASSTPMKRTPKSSQLLLAPLLSLMVTFPGTDSPNGRNNCNRPPSSPFDCIKSSVCASARTATHGTKARWISVRYSSDTPGGKLLGVPVPLSRDPGEKTEP